MSKIERNVIADPVPTVFERIKRIKEECMVRAIRNHPILGKGTNSVVDECYSDDDIIKTLRAEHIDSKAYAILYFGEMEGLDVDDVLDEELKSKLVVPISAETSAFSTDDFDTEDVDAGSLEAWEASWKKYAEESGFDSWFYDE